MDPYRNHHYLWTKILFQVAWVAALGLVVLGVVILARAWRFTEPPLQGEPFTAERMHSVEIQEVVIRVNRESRQTGAALLGGGMLSAFLIAVAIAVLDMSSCIQEEARMNAIFRRK